MCLLSRRKQRNRTKLTRNSGEAPTAHNQARSLKNGSACNSIGVPCLYSRRRSNKQSDESQSYDRAALGFRHLLGEQYRHIILNSRKRRYMLQYGHAKWVLRYAYTSCTHADSSHRFHTRAQCSVQYLWLATRASFETRTQPSYPPRSNAFWCCDPLGHSPKADTQRVTADWGP